jgi:hypothetical protein
LGIVEQPSDILRQLAAKGRRILSEYKVAMRSKKGLESNVTLGVSALDLFVDLSGYKSNVKRIGKAVGHSRTDAQISIIEGQTVLWTMESLGALNKISMIKGQIIPISSNSDIIATRFRKTQDYQRTDTRLQHGIQFLEQLANDHLIWNSELEKVRSGHETVSNEPFAPLASVESGLSSLIEMLKPFESECLAIKGALAVRRTKTPDWQRQALNSCRNAIENLVKRISGESEWSKGLEKLVLSKTRRETIRQVHSYLSAYGTHGGAIPSDSDVKFGIGLTEGALRYILTNHSEVSK